MPILKEFIKLDISTIYSDYQKAYSGLANYRIKCSKNEFTNNHINSIENLQRYSKYRLYKFKWIKRICFILRNANLDTTLKQSRSLY